MYLGCISQRRCLKEMWCSGNANYCPCSPFICEAKITFKDCAWLCHSHRQSKIWRRCSSSSSSSDASPLILSISVLVLCFLVPYHLSSEHCLVNIHAGHTSLSSPMCSVAALTWITVRAISWPLKWAVIIDLTGMQKASHLLTLSCKLMLMSF